MRYMPKRGLLEPIIIREPYPSCYVFKKPYGWTSYTLVDVAKQLFEVQKVGHAGTLDPLAIGELVVGVQTGTKFLSFWMESNKEYKVQMLLGMSTPSYDLETPEVEIQSIGRAPDIHTLEKVLKLIKAKTAVWVGPHSALKIGGTPFYASVHDNKHSADKLGKLHKNIIIEFSIKKVSGLSAFDLIKIINAKLSNLVKNKEFYKGLPIKHREIQMLLFDKFALRLKSYAENIEQYHSYKFVLVEMVLLVGKGTYVRYIVKQVSDMLGVPAVALEIDRRYRVNNKKIA